MPLSPKDAVNKIASEGCALWWYDFLKLPLFSSSLMSLQVNNIMPSSSSSSWWSIKSIQDWKTQPEAITIARLALTMMHPEEVNERIVAHHHHNHKTHHQQRNGRVVGLKSSGFYCVEQTTASSSSASPSSSTSSSIFFPIPLHLYVTTLELFSRRYTDARTTSPIEKNKIRSAFWKLAAFIAFRVVELEAHDIARALSVLSMVPPPAICGWDQPIFPPVAANSASSASSSPQKQQPQTTARDVCSYLSCQARLRARRYNALLALCSIEEGLPEASLLNKQEEVHAMKNRVLLDFFTQQEGKKKKKQLISSMVTDEEVKSNNNSSYNNKYILTAQQIGKKKNENNVNHNINDHSSASVVWSFVAGDTSSTATTTHQDVYGTLSFEQKSPIKQQQNNESSLLQEKQQHREEIVGKTILTQLIRKKPVSLNETAKMLSSNNNSHHHPTKPLYSATTSIISNNIFGPKERRRALIKRAEELLIFQSSSHQAFSVFSSSTTKEEQTSPSSSSSSTSLIWSSFNIWTDYYHQLSTNARQSMISAATESIAYTSMPSSASKKKSVSTHVLMKHSSHLRELAETNRNSRFFLRSDENENENQNLNQLSFHSAMDTSVAKAAFKSLIGHNKKNILLVSGTYLSNAATALIKSINNNTTSSSSLTEHYNNSKPLLSPFEIISKLGLSTSIPREILGLCAIQLSIGSLFLKQKKNHDENKNSFELIAKTEELVPAAQLHSMSGSIRPSESLALVMKFLGSLLSHRQENDNSNKNELFLDKVVSPLMSMIQNQSKNNNKSSDQCLEKSVLMASSSMLLDVCREIILNSSISTSSSAAEKKNKAENTKKMVVQNKGVPMLLSSALMRNCDYDTSTEEHSSKSSNRHSSSPSFIDSRLHQIVVSSINKSNNDNTLSSSSSVSANRQKHFVKLALLQSSMIEPLGFEYLSLLKNDEVVPVEEKQNENADNSHHHHHQNNKSTNKRKDKKTNMNLTKKKEQQQQQRPNQETTTNQTTSVIREKLLRKIEILEGRNNNSIAEETISSYSNQQDQALDLMLLLLHEIPLYIRKVKDESKMSNLLSQAQCEVVFEAKKFVDQLMNSDNSDNSDDNDQKINHILQKKIHDIQLLIDKISANRKDVRRYLEKKQKLVDRPKELELQRKRNMAALGLA